MINAEKNWLGDEWQENTGRSGARIFRKRCKVERKNRSGRNAYSSLKWNQREGKTERKESGREGAKRRKEEERGNAKKKQNLSPFPLQRDR